VCVWHYISQTRPNPDRLARPSANAGRRAPQPFPPVSVSSYLRIPAFALLISGLLGQPRSAGAQGTPAVSPERVIREYESREQIEALAKTAEAENRAGEAWLLRQRLLKGDFQESDRMVIVLQNSPTPADTYTVRAGKILQIPRFGEVSLEGVLRSELSETISKHLARFLRDPTVRTTPLIRLGVLGRVNRPGYYYPAADVILSDVLMIAGGPAGDADLNNVVIRRGPDVIWKSADTRTAIADGLTLDRLHLRAGDEIEVSQKKQFSWMSVIPIVSGIVLLVGTSARLR
jgi:protein involved in polysaccharide export with SLBB domain